MSTIQGVQVIPLRRIPDERGTIFHMLRHPMYAGTYVYGRNPIDPKRRLNRKNKSARTWVPRDEWKVMIHDRLLKFYRAGEHTSRFRS